MPEPSEVQRRILGDEIAAELVRTFDPVVDDDDFSSGDDTDFENEVFVSDAQKHWDESIKQLEAAIFLVICPVFGRMIGRRTARNLWIRFVNWRWAQYQAVVAER